MRELRIKSDGELLTTTTRDSCDSYDPLQQLLTSFPNDNNKHIDYVIAFRSVEANDQNGELLAKRFEFFNELKKEAFELYPIEGSAMTGQLNYMLLHCSTERLLKEAETVRLKMQLKNVSKVPV